MGRNPRILTGIKIELLERYFAVESPSKVTPKYIASQDTFHIA